MSARVAILGVAETVYPAGTGENLESLIYSAARGALDAAGLRRHDIDGIVLAASDQTAFQAEAQRRRHLPRASPRRRGTRSTYAD